MRLHIKANHQFETFKQFIKNLTIKICPKYFWFGEKQTNIKITNISLKIMNHLRMNKNCIICCRLELLKIKKLLRFKEFELILN